MIFKETAQQVLDGTKTQTRRLVKPGDRADLKLPDGFYAVQRGPNRRIKWVIGKTYAVQPGRGKRSIGRIRITKIRRERLQEIAEEDAKAEGVKPCHVIHYTGYYRTAFLGLWNSLYRKPYPLYDDEGNIVGYLKCSWEDNPEVWVLEFEREA